ncbi:uncharacterized protein BXZ73DRAFT_52794 [Epithele typhae]|uniref:uncharacterized protein n=1 Tax=Epithele typhae TaxID=378194 RepID=UPI002008D3C7|nr:uncharacterized protein BXZ73DRAFT_52794 [Epithele typhae]KAH9918736.1 hypothetical protein BXZ73DRAFT_52794 [Epithele typhae]
MFQQGGGSQGQGMGMGNGMGGAMGGGMGGGMNPAALMNGMGGLGGGMGGGMGGMNGRMAQYQQMQAQARAQQMNMMGGGGQGGGPDGPAQPMPTPPRQASLPPSATAASPVVSGTVPGMIAGTPVKASSIPPSSTTAVKTSSSPAPPASTTTAPTPQVQTKIVPQLNPLPANVTLEPKVTRVSVVPLADSDAVIPPLEADEITRVQAWMAIDKEYEGRHKAMQARMTEEMRRTVGVPRAWWEKDFTMQGGLAPDEMRRRRDKWVLTGLKSHKEKEIKDRKKMGKREGLRLPRRIPDEDAQRPEQLVPIRLEFDVEHHKMRDTFVWNLNDPIVTPEVFAQSVVDDYGLNSGYHATITKSIQEQLSDYKAHSTTFGEDGSMLDLDGEQEVLNGQIAGDDAAWWQAWRKRVRSKAIYRLPDPPAEPARTRKRRKVVKEEVAERPDALAAPGGEVPMAVDDFEEDENLMNEEMRILVKVDIIVGSYKLEDQFEWDLENADPTPEQFAEIYCTDLGLSGEFKTAIAHSIREQVQIYQKSLFLVGHPSDGTAVQDDDLRMSLLPSLTSGARSMEQVSAFTPQLNYLSESELEKNEKDREKELARRKRKTTRGRRGVALPDREPPKTYRTPAIGFPEISPAALALAAAVAAPTSRRAAAAAAQLTIANMVASENGTAMPLPQTLPTAPVAPVAPSASKEKKPRGLFKAPSYPQSALRPRAGVKAPIASTAADVSTLPPPLENDLPAPSSSGFDRQGSKVVLTAKRAKELEREAKEKEYADGQHANMIDGVWHCSNCGCPESIAVGRRKGPLGDKSQCGTCGKYWHRHRRPRPVTYNSSLEHHQGIIRAEEQSKSAAKRKRPQASVVEKETVTADDDAEMDTPGPSKPKSLAETPSAGADHGDMHLDRAVSPVSTASSTSESPLAHRVKMNGGGGPHSKSAPPPLPENAMELDPPPPPQSPPRSAPPIVQNTPVGLNTTRPPHEQQTDDTPLPARAPADGDASMADGLDHGDEGQVP